MSRIYRAAITGSVALLMSLLLGLVCMELLLCPDLSAQDYQDWSTQTIQERWYFTEADGTPILTPVRAYIFGADTSLTANQFDAVVDSSDSSQYWSSLDRTICALIVWIPADSVLEAGAVIHGRAAPRGWGDSLSFRTGSVTTRVIADSSVHSSDLQAGAVGELQIQSNAVGTAEIIDDSVQGGDIAAETITASELDTSSVGSSEIADGAVATADLAPYAVTAAKVDTSETYKAAAFKTDSYRSAGGDVIFSFDAQGRASYGTTSIKVDSIYAFTGTEVFFPNSKVSIGKSGTAGALWINTGSGWSKISAGAGAPYFEIPGNSEIDGGVLTGNGYGGLYWTRCIDGVGTITGVDTLSVNESFSSPHDFGGTVTLLANKTRCAVYVSGLESSGTCTANLHIDSSAIVAVGVYVYAANDSVAFNVASSTGGDRTIIYQGRKE